MKIAVTAREPDPASPIDPRFGRAGYFVVFDTDSNDTQVSDNAQNLNAARGAGIQAAQNVIALGVSAVLTGNVGPKAFSVLAAGGVSVYTGATGTAAEAFRQFRHGALQQAKQANVASHWS